MLHKTRVAIRFPAIRYLELHFGCHTCRLSYFTSVSLWFRLMDRLGQVTTVTTKFSYPRCSGASERAPLILVISRKETYAIIKSNQNVSIKQRSQTLSTFFFFSSQLHYTRRDTMLQYSLMNSYSLTTLSYACH